MVASKIFPSASRLLGKLWRLLDVGRRALLNLVLLALLAALVVVGVATLGPKPLKDRTVLVLDLRGPLVEQFTRSPLDLAWAQAKGESQKQNRLRDVLATLEAAAKDDKIAVVALELDRFGGGGLAALREVAAALERFKASGKPVITYGGRFDQRSYLLAASASEIYLHPMGMVFIEGFGRYRNYYRDALHRAGISANVVRVGTYKSFAEPYLANGPSKATLEADKYVYDELWAGYTRAIEAARKLPKGAIARGIEELPERLEAAKGDTAKLALHEKLIDGIKTRDEVRELLISRGARDDKGTGFRQVSFAEYRTRIKPKGGSGPAVGVVVAEGEIVDGEAPSGRVGGDSTAKLVRQAREDDQIKALVLRVNSPGGSVSAAEQVRREVELTVKAGKPVVVSMGSVAASGGYWISMSANELIADPATITGSVGVIAMLPTGDKLMEKLSIKTAGYGTTWLAGGYDPRRPLPPRLLSAAQSFVQHIYDEFAGKAALARKKSVAEIDAVAQGRPWTGSQALQRGLVDRVGSFGDAIQAAAKRAKLEGEPRVRFVEREIGKIEWLYSNLSAFLALTLGEALHEQVGIALPPALQEVRTDLTWAAELAEGGKLFGAVVHCLCAAP